jgi:hypothetical protein
MLLELAGEVLGIVESETFGRLRDGGSGHQELLGELVTTVESGHGSNSSSNSHHAPWLEACSPFDGGLPGFDTPKPSRRMGCE